MIQLMPRDYAIISFVKENGIALSSTIAERYFKSTNLCTNRLNKLEKAGFFESKLISNIHKGLVRNHTFELFPSLSNRVKAYKLGPVFKKDKAKSDDFTKSLIHQLYCETVRKSYEEKFDCRFTLENTLQSTSFEESPKVPKTFPDLVTVIDNKKLAIEIERKGRRGLASYNSNYEDRFFELLTEYDKLIYVVENESSLKKLIKKAEAFSRVGFSHILEPHKILRASYGTQPSEEFLNE